MLEIVQKISNLPIEKDFYIIKQHVELLNQNLNFISDKFSDILIYFTLIK